MGYPFLAWNILNPLHPLTLNLLGSYQVVSGMKLGEWETYTYNLHFFLYTS